MSKKRNLDNTVQTKVKSLLNELNNGLYGKEETLRIVLLAILGGESAFLLGEPGTAKSLIARRIAEGFEEIDVTKSENKGKVKCFEYLMNQFSTPDEVFGPVSLEALKKDEYRRITDRFLPKAQFAFLDEIWKASPAIQNSLLTILNEKKFHNGSEVQQVPLLGFIAASNELPEKGEGLEAIFDRFLVRIMEKPISGDSDFFNMITAPKNIAFNIEEKLSETDLIEWQKQAELVELPENCKEVIRKIRIKLNELNKQEDRGEEEKYIVSDRRWKKIIGLLKMSAFINGRTKIDLTDCSIISYCIWSTEEQSKEVQEIVESSIIECIQSGKISFDKLEKSIQEFGNAVRSKYDKARSLKKSFLQSGIFDSTPAELDLVKICNELDTEYYFPIKAEIDNGRADYEKSIDASLVEWNGNLFKNQNVVRALMANKSVPLERYDQLSLKLDSIKKYYSDKNQTAELPRVSTMTRVSGGNFIMGGTKQDEGPMHAVTLSSFSIGSLPVTYREFCDVMGIKAPDNFSDLDKSVRNVSWYDAITYCNKLSFREDLRPCYHIDGVDFLNITYKQIPRQRNNTWDNVKCDFYATGYRLPTEAEWEFAARGGNNHDNYIYSGTNNRSEIQDVKKSVCNSLGIYDMSGGVNELCWDWLGKYPSTNVTNPTKSVSNKNGNNGAVHVCRGGSNAGKLAKCTVTARSYVPTSYDRLPDMGFRICKTEDRNSFPLPGNITKETVEQWFGPALGGLFA